MITSTSPVTTTIYCIYDIYSGMPLAYFSSIEKAEAEFENYAVCQSVIKEINVL